MCGIYYGPAKDWRDALRENKDRGLDGVGFVDQQGNLNKIAPTKKYQDHLAEAEFITHLEKNITDEGRIILHNRKAKIGTISSKNAQPFWTERFALVQNGTANAVQLLADHMKIKEEVDSHSLLRLIEYHVQHTSGYETLEEAELYLMWMSEYQELGNIFLLDFTTWNVLFWSDGARPSFIMHDEKVKHIECIKSYGRNGVALHKNEGGIVFQFATGKVYSNSISDMNKQEARALTSTIYSPYDYRRQYSDYSGVAHPPLEDDFDLKPDYYDPDTGEPTWFKKKTKKQAQKALFKNRAWR